MASLNSSDLILQKLPLANSTSVDIAPFAFETDKTGIATVSYGGKRRKTVRKRAKRVIKRKSTCRKCGGWKLW
jgi:hypothetical protein